MGISPITITALSATPTLRGNKLAAVVNATGPAANLTMLMLNSVEFYSSTVNDFTTATKAGEGNPEFLDAGLIEEQTYYYWARARANNGSPGAVYPASPTAGIACTAIGMSGLLFAGLANGKFSVTENANALTIALKTVAGNDPSAGDPVYVGFRNSTLTGGNYIVRQVTAALSLTISAGSTQGVSANTPFNNWILLIDDGGTFRLGLIVCTTSTTFYPLDESRLISSTAEGGAGAADSAGVVYTGVAVAAKSFRVGGFITWNAGLATPGNWTAHDAITLYGPGVKKPGELIQSVQNLSAAVATGTTPIPPDATIPQNTEGDQFFSTPLIPSSPANWIEHDILLYGNSQAAIVTVALFQDSNVNAIAGMAIRANDPVPSGMVPVALSVRHRHQALTSSSTTFNVRAGSNVGGASGAFVLNALYNYTGPASLQLLGGVMRSGHKITEYMG